MINSPPLVSIIIPVYNGSNFLREAINSALEQTYENKEIIVINDGSNDQCKTEEIALSYGERISYYSKENGGVASALNFAIDKMKGYYFSWLSHDDLYYKDKVKRQIETLLSLGEGKIIIYSDYSIFTTDSNLTRPVKMDGFSPKNFRYWLTVKNCLGGCTLLIPKEAFIECGKFDEKLTTTQDYDLWFRLAKNYRFVHLAEVLVKSRQHSLQGSIQMSDLVQQECDELLSKFINNLPLEEITYATKVSIGASFKIIEESMRIRNFINSANLARDLAKKHGAEEVNEIPIQINNKFSFKTYVRNILHFILPAIFFFTLKNFLCKIGFLNPQIDHTEKLLKNKFTEVYEKDLFGGSESRSGEGSNLIQTEIISKQIPKIIKEFQIKTLIDAPCGDWYWMRYVSLEVDQYIGIDIVEPLIAKNNKEFARPNVRFEAHDLSLDSLPKADMIFSRDLLVHLNFEDAFKVIANFKKSGAKYLLTTTFTGRKQNDDFVNPTDFWRALNLEIDPFNFPKPLLIINEGCTEEGGLYADKSLGLWLLESIKLPKEWY